MDIKHLSNLAQITILKQDEAQVEKMLEKILNYFDEIGRVDVAGIEPLISPLDQSLILREDELKEGIPIDEVFQNAAESHGNLFKVPPVV